MAALRLALGKNAFAFDNAPNWFHFGPGVVQKGYPFTTKAFIPSFVNQSTAGPSLKNRTVASTVFGAKPFIICKRLIAEPVISPSWCMYKTLIK